MTRRLARYAILFGPFLALYILVKFGAPPLSAWVRNRLAGEGYQSFVFPGRAAEYEVHAAGPRARERARAGAGFLDAALLRVCEEGREFGLRPPERLLRLMLLEEKDLHGYSRVAANDELKWNGGFFDPERLEIVLLAGDVRGLTHEGTHLLFAVAAPRGISSWLDEGLACTYEHRGLRRPRGPAPNVTAVVRAGPKDFTSEENDTHYRNAELLVTWLLDAAEPPVREAFVRFVRREMDDGPSRVTPERFAAVLGFESAEELDRRVAQWAEGR